MFLLASSIFALFTIFYGLLSGAIIYHLRQYVPTGNRMPKTVVLIFIFFSVFFWLLALTFIFKIPR